MGFYRGPHIVTDGLISHLDAGNTKSYPGSGTTVYDLSKNGKHGTLTNGTTITTSNSGVFSFDGTNDTIGYGTGNTFFPLPQLTLTAWVQSSGLGPSQTVGGIWGVTYGLRYYINTNGTLRAAIHSGVSDTTITSPQGNMFDGNWHYTALTHTGTVATLYLDGVNVVSASSTWPGTTNWPTNTVSVGRDQNDSVYYLNGKLAIPQVYNRALTAAEVLQNYNATKSRYNL